MIPFAALAQQQASLSNPLGGDINAASTNCSVVLSCVWQKLPATATTTTITISGTFVATLPIETSADGGVTFTTSSTQSAAAVVTLTTTSLTDVRVRASAYTSGKASVNISTAGNQISVTVNQGGGISPNSPVPAASQQGPAYNVRNYGAVGDAKSSRNCTTVITTTVTSSDNPWDATVVGKKFQMVVSSLSDFGAAGGGNQNNEVTVTVFNSAGSITVSASSTQNGSGDCVWYTQQDDVKMLAAYSAADAASQKAFDPGLSSPTLAHPGQVFIPKGGYVVCGTIYNDLLTHVTNNNEGVSLIGESGTDIYVAPCFVPPAGATGTTGSLILAYLNLGAEFGKLRINGMAFRNTNFSANTGLVGWLTSGKEWIHDINITDWGTNNTNTAAFQVYGAAGLSRIENVQVANGSSADQSTGCLFNGAGVDIYSSFCSNHFVNFIVINSGQRTVFAPHFVLHGYQNDESGANGLASFQIQNSTVNCIGCEILNPGGGVASFSLDTTSFLYLTDSYASAFGSDGGNSCAATLAGNAQVIAMGSTFAGNNASAAICGPSTSSFIDGGGNKWFNSVASVLTACTAATYTTCAFSGGIVPKATVTHTPNTVVAVQGNLLATAQNLATFVNDQNYQLVNITAQSGGTTPANSACATPPVITFSDGTRTATLTMTTAKTQWSSAVDTFTGANQVFASGTTLTISIGANTCATPPVNVSVSYVLQSVLNP